MPVLTEKVAGKLADRVIEKVRQATLASIWGKIQSQEFLLVNEMITYAKTQKKDSYYNSVAPIWGRLGRLFLLFHSRVS